MKRHQFAVFFLLLCAFTFGWAPLPRMLRAQSTPVCPTSILLDVSRAASTCFRLEPGEICAGNGAISASGFAGEVLMAEAGDRADLSAVNTLSAALTDDDLGIVTLSSYDGGEPLAGAFTLVVLGDVTLTNQVTPWPTLDAIAIGSVNIRNAPRQDAELIAHAGVNDGLIVNGRSGDNRWARVAVPGEHVFGWASVDVLNIRGNLLTLELASPGQPVLDAFRVFDLTTGADTACEGGLPSGILLQSANNEQSAFMQIGSTRLQVHGTAFVTARNADSGPSVYALAGYAIIYSDAGDLTFVPAGGVHSAASVVPLEPASVALLPVQLLPVSIRLPAAITEADIARLTEAHLNTLAAAQATPTPQPTADPTICRRVTRGTTTLYAGPGEFYEAINSLPAGASVRPVVAASDPDGRIWWQLTTSNWLLTSQVRETGLCPDVPRTQNITPPRNNTLSLETCETTNGPLRAGQQVTIQFTPPAFDNWGEARDAVRIDPGRISVGARTYRAQATSPIRLGTTDDDERYLRTFYIVWNAVPGTHRIVGDRLSYEPICTLVVPVG